MDPTARSVALAVLNAPPGKAFADERLDTALNRGELSRLDRRLATELVYGVLRRRGTLDALLTPLLNHPPAPKVMNLLRLGAYQLAFLDHVPAHAAIDTAVDLTPETGSPKSRGFVNAVLRGVTRFLAEEDALGPAADAYPRLNGQYRRLFQPVLPDPASDPAGYIAAAFSLPGWMVERWLPRFGVEEMHRLGFWFAGPAPIWLRVNPRKTSREQFLVSGVNAEPGDAPQSLKLLGPAAISELPGYAEGHFCVQDHTSQEVAAMLDSKPAWRVLDRCAAPGGKSTHLAELMQDQGEVVSCDVDARKIATIETLAQRLGLRSVKTVTLRRDDPPPEGPFDAALVDAPCSNTGVLGRRPEVRWRLRPEDLTELAALQLRLLLESIDRVRPGGVVVYSTCSIEPEENEAVVRAAMAERPGIVVEAEVNSVPGRPSDGGYRARLVTKNN
ncbi:MAG: 16S rRNA (cytosine(967)-C(5))-methyltransferase RsmB [Gemmataceae bacterium]